MQLIEKCRGWSRWSLLWRTFPLFEILLTLRSMPRWRAEYYFGRPRTPTQAPSLSSRPSRCFHRRFLGKVGRCSVVWCPFDIVVSWLFLCEIYIVVIAIPHHSTYASKYSQIKQSGIPWNNGSFLNSPFLVFLRPLYHQAVTVQRDFNILVHKIAGDGDFLRKTLGKTIEGTACLSVFWRLSKRKLIAS